MSTTRRLWLGLAALLIVGFSTLLWMGGEIYRQAPPMPEAVVAADGTTLYTRADIELGRQVWQSIGGQQLGSIWGHGALVAPDWTADGLHREAVAWLDLRAQNAYGKPYDALGEGDRAKLQAELKPLIRANTYDASTGRIVVSDERAQAIAQVSAHYRSLFSSDPGTRALRETYAMRENTIADEAHRRAIGASRQRRVPGHRRTS